MPALECRLVQRKTCSNCRHIRDRVSLNTAVCDHTNTPVVFHQICGNHEFNSNGRSFYRDNLESTPPYPHTAVQDDISICEETFPRLGDFAAAAIPTPEPVSPPPAGCDNQLGEQQVYYTGWVYAQPMPFDFLSPEQTANISDSLSYRTVSRVVYGYDPGEGMDSSGS
jgi:hypothetical protein